MRLDAAARSALAQLTRDGTRTSEAVRKAIIQAAGQQAAREQRSTEPEPTRRPRQQVQRQMPVGDEPEYKAWVKQQAEAAPPLGEAQLGVLLKAFEEGLR